mgnify:CR=1 FL=1
MHSARGRAQAYRQPTGVVDVFLWPHRLAAAFVSETVFLRCLRGQYALGDS